MTGREIEREIDRGRDGSRERERESGGGRERERTIVRESRKKEDEL
jgi:hypothetical protein